MTMMIVQHFIAPPHSATSVQCAFLLSTQVAKRCHPYGSRRLTVSSSSFTYARLIIIVRLMGSLRTARLVYLAAENAILMQLCAAGNITDPVDRHDGGVADWQGLAVLIIDRVTLRSLEGPQRAGNGSRCSRECSQCFGVHWD